MAVNKEKLLAELTAAGLQVKALGIDGRLVLADGTIVDPADSGSLEHEDPQATPDAVSGATAYAIVQAHDPTQNAQQIARRLRARGGAATGALAVVLLDGAAAPQWAKDLVAEFANRARNASA